MRVSEWSRSPLRWHQPKALERRYVLAAGASEVATLSFRSAFGSLAAGESADGSWTFKRVGFFQSRITVREAGREADLAVYHPATWSAGGTLTFPDGRGMRVTTNFWQTRVDVLGPGDEPLLHITVGGLLRLSADVEVLPSAIGLADLPWMLMLACYLIVGMRDEAATVATIAAG